VIRKRPFPLVLVLVTTIVVALVILFLAFRPTWTVDRVRHVVIATLQEETPASELVTGRVGVTAQSEIADRGRFSWIPDWVGIPGLNLIGAGVSVEVVGEALYGFDVRAITPEMITFAADGVIEVELPAIRVIAVEPDLSRLQIRTREGILRPGAGRTLEAEALSDVQHALRRQGERHVQVSAQPKINSGRALAATLRPALQAAGMPDPRFRFRVGPDLILEPGLHETRSGEGEPIQLPE